MSAAGGRHAVPRPPGYATVLRNREFRAIYAAQVLSFAGDQIARIAVALAVFAHSRSALLTATAYAVSYIAGVVAAPLMSSLADRFPRRNVMIGADVARLALVGGMTAASGSVPVLLGGMVLVAAIEPGFKSARAATLPKIVRDDQYSLALSLFAVTSQVVQFAGYAVGGAVAAAMGTRWALTFDAVTFAASALLILGLVVPRPAAGVRLGAVRGTRDAARALWSNEVVRSAVVLTWCGAAFGVVPEGLAVVYAHAHHAGAVGAGLLTAALPAGTAVGALAVGRIRSESARQRAMRLLAVATFVPMVITVTGPSLPVAFLLWACSGAGGAFSVIAYRVLTLGLPDHQRGRAFGLASTVLLAVQGLALLAAGAVADLVQVRYVVAGAGAAGLLAAAALTLSWPSTLPGQLRPAEAAR